MIEVVGFGVWDTLQRRFETVAAPFCRPGTQISLGFERRDFFCHRRGDERMDRNVVPFGI